MNAPHPNQAPQSQMTLAQINEMLNDAGFPIINPEKVQQLQNLAPRDRIIRAIQSAKADSGARAFLTNLFQQAGIVTNSQPQPAPQPAPAPVSTASPSDDPRMAYPRGNQAPQSNARENPPRVAPEDRKSVHVYGGKAALCFEADITKGGIHTVALDGATATSPRNYDWEHKVRVQMTRQELPVVAAVLCGVLPSCEFKNHGEDNTKGFSIERQQGGKFYIKVFAKNSGVRGVPVMAPDAFYVASLIMRQLQKESPWLDGTSLMSLIRATQSHQ